ncbi:kinase-like domain-containing protein, partial [Crucibulum laeve]
MDIEQYLDSRLKGSARIHAFYATNPNILSVLVEHAEGNFACADAMATNLVANLESWKTLNLNQLANRLMKNVFTSQLDYLYTSALPSEEEIDQLALDKEDIAEVFSTLTVLREPLSLQSIESISNIPAEQVIEVIENFQSVVWISEGQNSVIRFIHSSFSDFLVDKSRYLASTIPTNVPEYNNRLAVSCLQLLNGSSIRHEKICQFLGCSTPSLHSGVQHDRVKKGIPPPLRYACLHWFAHLSSGNVTETAIEQFERFLSTRSLVWLEYLEVLGKLDIAAEILLNARIWYEKQALKDEYSTLDLIEEVLIELEESQKVETTSIYQRSNQSRTSLASSHCNTHISRGSRRMARRDFTPADLSSYIHRDQSMCVGGGSHADVYKGFYINGSINTEVAIKVVRSHFCIDERKQEVNKRIRREIWFWQRLNHPNILPFLGVTSGFGIYLSMVCPWMKDGNLGEYLTNTEITLTLKRRQKLLEDVVAGIQYLHSQAIIHGDLNSANILIHEDKACLSDFGLSCFISRFNGPSFMRSTVGGAARWTAPELYFEHPKITKACDVYSFGCVALHVFSGEIPFCNITSAYEVRVLMELMQGRHPPRPIKHILTDVYWDFILFCWGTCMEDRPDIAEANTRLLKINNDPSGRQSGGVINQLREDEALQFQ